MSVEPTRNVFINLVVNDLKKSSDFFSALGFRFNPQFTGETAACMILSDTVFVMLVTEPLFRTFTKKQPCDTKSSTEVLLCFSCPSRAEVDAIARKAIEQGGSPAMDPTDHEFMYSAAFYDLDGHHWEAMWMDPKAIQ
jgi:predicted lactoylglutathione lyase